MLVIGICTYIVVNKIADVKKETKINTKIEEKQEEQLGIESSQSEKEKDENEETQENVDTIIVNEKIEIEKIIDLIDIVDLNETEIYEAEFLNANTMLKSSLIDAGIQILNKNKNCSNDESIVTIEELNSAIKNYFDINYELTFDDIRSNSKGSFEPKVGNEENPRFYEYSYSHSIFDSKAIGINIINNKLYVFSICCFGTGPMDHYDKKLEKIEKDNNYIYIYYKVAYACDYHNGKFNYYRPLDKNTIIEEIKIDNLDNVDYSKYDTYKLTYKKSGDNLLFVSSEVQK